MLCSALVLATALSTVAGAISSFQASCETAENQTEKVEIVDEFLISSWVSYYGTDVKSYAEQTKEMAEAGLNFQWHIGSVPTCASSDDLVTPSYEEVERIYSQYGM